MTYNFCTFFNKKFLFQGLALYDSLERHARDFTLWVLCLDDETYAALEILARGEMRLIRLRDFENPQLLAVKDQPGRSYYGTIKPSFIAYVLEKNPNVDSVHYIDSDLFLFSSPVTLYDSFLNDASQNILVAPHNFPVHKKFLETRGIFNAGVVSFKNNPIGRSCLEDWKEKCIQICENRPALGHYGDQGYMDAWPAMFPGVWVAPGKGSNLGPWNVSQYTIKQTNGGYCIDNDPLVFYHFSSLRIYSPTDFLLFDYAYRLSKAIRKKIYRPYLAKLKNIIEEVMEMCPSFSSFECKPAAWGYFKYRIKYNIVHWHITLKRKSPLYAKFFYTCFKKPASRGGRSD